MKSIEKRSLWLNIRKAAWELEFAKMEAIKKGISKDEIGIEIERIKDKIKDRSLKNE